MYTTRKKYKMAGKKPSHRNAVIKSQVLELVRSGRIKTTPTKAKILKSQFDRLVTTAKKNTIASKRELSSFFGNNQKAADRLVMLAQTKLNDRNSGYTRTVKTLPRSGDNAPQAYIMLVNYEAKLKKSRLQKVLETQESKKDKKSKKASNRQGLRSDDAKKKIKNTDVKDSSQSRRRVSM